jgi:hypothetical protein
MRLLKCCSLTLEDFRGKDVPPYVALSHTWSKDEVLYKDLVNPTDKVRNKGGYAKVESVCRVALEHAYEYVWMDTCCIDKSSSAALQEAIN